MDIPKEFTLAVSLPIHIKGLPTLPIPPRSVSQNVFTVFGIIRCGPLVIISKIIDWERIPEVPVIRGFF
jgi:hypothetical protein